MKNLFRAVAFMAVATCTFATGNQTPGVSARGQMFIGAWPHHVLVLDEDKQEVVDRIDTGSDVPMQLLISTDRKKVYVFTARDSNIVTIDVATHKVADTFKLDSGGVQYRIAGGAVDTDGKYLYSIVVPTIKKIDRFDQDPPKFIVVDLAQHKIVRSSDFPKEEDHYGLGGLYVAYALRISPDNKFLYMFKNDILIFQTSDFKLVDTIALAKPSYPGVQTVSLNLVDDPYEAPGTVTSLFVAADPVVHRPVFGIATVDLNKRTVDFRPVGPHITPMMSLWVTPDRSTGYTVSMTGSQGNKRSEFWVFDMKTNKLIRKSEFDGRRRFDLALSPNGKMLMIYVAGFQVECYDPQSLKLTKTIDLNADSTSNMVMVPGA